MRLIQAGTTDQSITFRALTSAGATATPAFGDAGIAATYKRDATGAATTITPVTQTSTGAHTDGGLVHIGGGECRLDLPDAAVADGATRVKVTINATGWVGFTEEILLVDYDPTGPVNANVTAMAAGVITPTAIATGAIDADALAGDAVAEIQSGLATAAALAALNNLSSAQAQTAAAAALTAYDPPTQAELTAGLAAADDAVLAAIAARPSVADFWSGITATAGRFIADHTLRRSWASAAVSANGDTLSFRSLLGAVAKLVNRVGISGATLTVYQDDDTTALGEQTLTSDAAAEPIISVDTVG